MDNMMNSNSMLISGDDSNVDDYGMNGMNMMPDNGATLVSGDDFYTGNYDAYNSGSGGLISANTPVAQKIPARTMQPSSDNSVVPKNTNTADSIRSKLGSIESKSGKLQGGSKPETKAPIPATQPAEKLTEAVATGVKNAGPVSQQKAAAPAAKSAANNVSSVKQIISLPEVKTVRLNRSIQDLSDSYIVRFKQAFDIDLIPSICYENMMKLFSVDVVDKPTYYMCNTYRLSSIINLMEYFVPWVYSTFIFGNASSQNLQTYKDIIRQETELHATGNFNDLVNVYKKRYMDRITDELYVDCVTVTPGASFMATDLIETLEAAFKDVVSRSSGKLNNVYKINVGKLADTDISNARFVHSNFWYLLQIYEFNIADKRSSMTKTAIKAKEALKF